MTSRNQWNFRYNPKNVEFKGKTKSSSNRQVWQIEQPFKNV